MGKKEEEVAMERSERGWVVVKPKANKKFGAKAIDWLEKVIVKLMYNSGSNSKACHFLSGNFAPVDETPPCKDLPVKGYLPVSTPLQLHFLIYADSVKYFYIINVS
ncbi:carotenoid 9,10(9',10')-cleavage dioxygenase 1 [Nicotiana attenuata]|uniref:Carotenoid 9,10(9',10')-cleavage dioxygenase 1 n=1 Tax=Nicotiana attenuata TaxID=49451 RepID=A0A1J6JAY7_NICAT|nr:carotenoid 9,10(9',10')-cleavage dioxygenase 1 [Nicotiana attenuata]